MNFEKLKVGMNILPKSKACHNHSIILLIPPHFRTRYQDLCHGTIGTRLIKILKNLCPQKAFFLQVGLNDFVVSNMDMLINSNKSNYISHVTDA